MPRIFNLVREVDSTGLSGTGIVAQGIQFDNGNVVVCWLLNISSIVLFENLEDFKSVSCSHSRSEVKFI